MTERIIPTTGYYRKGCPGCGAHIWWWQRRIACQNGFFHESCDRAWSVGYIAGRDDMAETLGRPARVSGFAPAKVPDGPSTATHFFYEDPDAARQHLAALGFGKKP